MMVCFSVSAFGWNYWDNGGSDRYWTTAANWQSDVLPAEGESPRVDMAGDSCAIITSSMTSLPIYQSVAVGGSGSGEIKMLGGVVSCNNISIGTNAGASGLWDIRGGAVTASASIVVGSYGSGTLSIVNATVNAYNAYTGSLAGSNGSLVIQSGANFNVATSLKISPNGSSAVSVSGGTITVGSLILCEQSVSVAQVSISGGKIIVNSISFGDGNAVIDLCGGELIVSGQQEAPTNLKAFGGNPKWYVKAVYNSTLNQTVFSADRLPEVSCFPEMFDYTAGDTLGLISPPLETFMLYTPVADTDMRFSNHPQLIEFKGMLYANWVWHPEAELSAISYVAYSRSADGKNWSKPRIVGPEGRACGGWWTDGETLVWYTLRGSNTEAMTSTDGLNFSEPQVIITNASPSESPMATPTGRLIMPCHGTDAQGVRCMRIMYTDDPRGLSGWQAAVMPHPPEIAVSGTKKAYRPIEPSWYVRRDGVLVMLFRDLWWDIPRRTWKLLEATSTDNGQTWTMPAITNIPDSDSMQCAGNLPDGTAYFISNPIPTRRRVPLTITLSKDGWIFDRSYLVRGTPQERRFYDDNKTLGYSYPGRCISGGYMYISYATNKEDVEVTRIPLSHLMFDKGFKVVEDFDGYNGNADVTEVWDIDGQFELHSTPEKVHSGKSLEMKYDLSSAESCRILRNFAPARDWSSANDVYAIDISVKGNSLNSPAFMQLLIGSGANQHSIYLSQDSAATQNNLWQVFRFDIADFGIDCGMVDKIGLIIQRPPQASTCAGSITIDDIRLYSQRCLDSFPRFDFSGNCTVDIEDLPIFFNEWLNVDGFFPS